MTLLFAMRTFTVATAYKKVTMITSTHILTLSSSRWKGLHFLLSRINKLNRDFFHWQCFSLVCPLRNHVTRFYLISPWARAKMMDMSWIRSIKAGGGVFLWSAFFVFTFASTVWRVPGGPGVVCALMAGGLRSSRRQRNRPKQPRNNSLIVNTV